MYVCIHASTHKRSNGRTHTFTIHTHASTHTCTNTHKYAHSMCACTSCVPTHTRTQKPMHKHMYTNTHAHTRTEIERASFSFLVFSTSGGMGTTATVVYKRFASILSDKHNQPYSKMLYWLCCKLSFFLLLSSIRCLRGSRSSIHNPAGPLTEHRPCL